VGPFLAATPLVAVLGLMIGLRWRAAHAGLAALALACLIAVAAFGLGTTTIASFGPAGALGGTLLEALFTAVTILWIVFPALAIYELQNRSGALHTLREAVSHVSSAPRTQVILIAWFFGLFMEGVAGFGTPVALTAPLLVGLGFTPVRAVALALIGHAAGVSFGALGTPLLAQAALTSVSAADIARETAMLHALLGWSLLACLVWLADDKRPSAKEWGVAALAAVCFFLPFLALAWWTGPELPTAGAALIGGICFAAFVRRRRLAAQAVSVRAIAMAALPYLVIVVLVLVTRLIPPISEALRAPEVSWSLGGIFTGAFQPFYHPGILLALGFVIGAVLQGRTLRDLVVASGAAVSRLLPVAVALFAMLALSRVMVHGGLIGELANAAAGTAGLWPLLSPLVGVLGTFVTGSATASNILFTPFQSATAAALDLPASRMLAAQGFGAAVGNIVCPHNIIAGGATVGLKGQEGEVLRQVIGVCALYAVAGGLLLLWLSR
jgi:lactate permease